jgi:carbonic anhydrase/acetyltransferase-like protein (isoleucine patch superfamily)
MPIYEFEGRTPSIDPDAYVSETAVVIGDVRLAGRVYVGPGAILRADYGTIVVDEESAIEEGAILHINPGMTCHLERRVTVGHGAKIHCPRICAEAVIGIGAILSFGVEVGRGAIFRIYLPWVERKALKEKAFADAPLPRGTETILLVEDQAEVRRFASTCLRSFGYHVIEAESGEEALHLFEAGERPVDLLFTDVVMPGMTGVELSKKQNVCCHSVGPVHIPWAFMDRWPGCAARRPTCRVGRNTGRSARGRFA